MSSSAAAFSSSDTAALERQTEQANDDEVKLEQIWCESNRKVCLNWIRQNGYKRICLQFPDSYLPHSNAISDSIKAALTAAGVMTVLHKVFILADTSYGSCCVDEIAAAHVDADCLLHFGNACRSKAARLPVLYVFPQMHIDLPAAFKQLQNIRSETQQQLVCVYLDIGYHHLLEQQPEEQDEDCLNKLKEALMCKDLQIEVFPAAEDAKLTNDDEEASQRICLFVGADNQRFFNLSLTTKAAKWYLYNPATQTLDQKNPLTANYMRRRYYYIEKCKDARTLGLTVATLTAQGYLDVVARLQEMARAHGIKTQIVSVGRINPAKLANFLEIDCFVLIGCPFNHMYTDKDFYKPIVSVFEAEIALNPAWLLKYPDYYVTDFKQLLPEGRNFLSFNAEHIVEQDVSLISGRVRNNMQIETAEEALENTMALSAQQQSVAIRAGMEVMSTNVGLTFEDRTWKGLDPALGCTEPAKLEMGRSGVPMKYTHNEEWQEQQSS